MGRLLSINSGLIEIFLIIAGIYCWYFKILTIKISVMEEHVKCSICLENKPLKPFLKTKLPCNHIFHSECLFQNLEYDNRCPLCRDKFDDTVIKKIERNYLRYLARQYIL